MTLTKKDWLGIKIAFGAILFVVVFATILIWISDRNVFDQYGCIVDSEYRNTVVLVDNTSEIAESQADYLGNLTIDLSKQVNMHDRLTIYTFSGQNSFNPIPKLSMCKPPSKHEVSEWNSNVRRVQNEFKESFLEPMNSVIVGAKDDSSAHQSPIIEFLEGMASNLSATGIDRVDHLIIVSDLLQNTRAFSQLRTTNHRYESLPKDYRNVVASIRSSNIYRSTDVRVIYLVQETYKNNQNRSHIAFWEKVMFEIGADITELQPVR